MQEGITWIKGDTGKEQLLLNDTALPLESFESCHRKYSGPVFIIASGPSVLDFPIEKYRNYPMIAMNGSICCLQENNVQPLFYLCDDIGVVAAHKEAFRLGVENAKYCCLGDRVIFNAQQQIPGIFDGRKIYMMQRVNRFLGGTAVSDRRFAWCARSNPDFEVEWSLFNQKKNRIGFSRNLCKGYFNGRTIAYSAVQLAYHLGFDKIFLVGVDMGGKAEQFYFCEAAGSMGRSRILEDFPKYILPSFDLMSRKVINKSFSVFNLSASSRIPSTIVPKINIASLDKILSYSNKTN